ncbi:MAG: putative ABC transporter permease [Atopobiaceae bacterium]|jgi:uncharacterized membrane protein
MSIAATICLFAICSFAGWLWETLYAIITTGKWERRGFLYGPVCPIYGVGVVSIILLVRTVSGVEPLESDWWRVFLVSCFGAMLLEFVTSWVMEKLFNAYWWDYSNIPTNIQGRTCLPAGLVFGLGGILAVYVVMPAVNSATTVIPELAFQIASYIIVAITFMDITTTVSVLTDFEDKIIAANDNINTKAENLTELVASKVSQTPGIIVESGEKLEHRATQAVISSMDSLHKSALSRVRGFRSAKKPEISEALSWSLEYLKSLRK